MRELTTQAERHVDAPADQVWAYRLDFLHLPDYNSAVQGIERLEAGAADGTGASYQFDLVTGSHSNRIGLRVTEAVPGQRVAIEMDGMLPARETFTVAPTSTSASGPSDTGACVATIALTLLVPDHFPADNDAALLANGEAQIAGELDRMRDILGASPKAGGDLDG